MRHSMYVSSFCNALQADRNATYSDPAACSIAHLNHMHMHSLPSYYAVLQHMQPAGLVLTLSYLCKHPSYCLLHSYCTALKSLSAANWFEHLCPLADNIIISFLLTPDVITQSNVITKRATFCDSISSYSSQSLANLQWLHRIGARIIL